MNNSACSRVNLIVIIDTHIIRKQYSKDSYKKYSIVGVAKYKAHIYTIHEDYIKHEKINKILIIVNR